MCVLIISRALWILSPGHSHLSFPQVNGVLFWKLPRLERQCDFFLWMDEVQGQESLLGIEIWTLNYNFTKHVFQTVIFGHFEREGTMGAQKRL